MADSDTQICNMALRKLGARLIASLTEDSEEAITCNLFYSPVRDALLREHPWNFAVKRVSLALLVDAPAFGYAFQYQLPADCLRVRSLDDPTAEFAVEGRRLLTDLGDAKCIYTARMTAPSLYDPLFTTALYTKLGMEIAEQVTGSTQKVKELQLLHQNAMMAARLADASEVQETAPERDQWLESRGNLPVTDIFRR